jgi:integrase
LFQVKKLQASTITVYRAAIAAIHQGWNGVSVGGVAELSKLIKSFFLERPPSKVLLPSWSLPLVLSKLNEAPFEPLDGCSLKCLTLKAVFLLALASGRRMGDLHALSIEKGHLRWEPYGMRLTPRLGYLAKNESKAHRAKPIFIPKFGSYATEGEDLRLCPVRALDLYVKKTRRVRNKEKQLFLSYQNHKPISKERMSNWIVETIRYAYGSAKEADFRLHAHSTRSLSTSWALFQGASMESIVQAAFWVNESTFSSFYLRDVLSSEGEFARAVLSSGKQCTALDPVH